MTTHFVIAPCALGQVLVAQNAQGICAILLGDEPAALIAELQQCCTDTEACSDNRALNDALSQVIAFIAAPRRAPALPLAPSGSEFQQKVWTALQQIPCGEIRSYSQLAAMIGAPTAVRAVASACAANKLAVCIPCHRVVRSNGDLSGYRWGLERKKQLLKRELELQQH